MLEQPGVSIVIPTHRRAQILRSCLEHLSNQTIREELEVIVVSDGPDKETAEMLRSRTWAMPVDYLEIPKSQQGTARNRGVEKARREVCMFINDDIFLDRAACEEHQLAHAALQYTNEIDVAVLGQTVWDPALEQTPVMRWLDETGWQFGYKMLAEYEEDFVSQEVQHRFVYASHLSVPTSIAKRVPFREDVSLYGWEDIEWGLRLKERGVRLFYAPTAKAVHHHALTLDDSLRRMETLGRSARVFSQLHPDFDRLPKGWKYAAYQVLGLLPTMRGKHARAFVRGLKEESQG